MRDARALLRIAPALAAGLLVCGRRVFASAPPPMPFAGYAPPSSLKDQWEPTVVRLSPRRRPGPNWQTAPAIIAGSPCARLQDRQRLRRDPKRADQGSEAGLDRPAPGGGGVRRRYAVPCLPRSAQPLELSRAQTGEREIPKPRLRA